MTRNRPDRRKNTIKKRRLGKKRHHLKKRQLNVEALDARVLLDASDALVAGITEQQIDEMPAARVPRPALRHDTMQATPALRETVSDAALQHDGTSRAHQAGLQSIRTEMVFVDAAVEQSETLIKDLLASRPGIVRHVVPISNTADGLVQIADALESVEAVDAVHIVSHGSQAQLRLGATTIDGSQLTTKYAATLHALGKSLTDDADILIYGCDLAGNAEGEAFVEAFSDLTGADVAASSDSTGHESLGGDWDLERAVGVVNTHFLAAAAWQGVLADPAPLTTIDMPTTVFLGEDVDFTVSFDNASPDTTGFGPYIDLYMPAAGPDGAVAVPLDGLSFNSATYLGSPVASEVQTFDALGEVTHPFATDAGGNPLVITGTPGDQLVVLSLPFGSFAPGQPAAQIQVNGTLSEFADLGTALNVAAIPGFRYGKDALDNPGTDPIVTGPTATSFVQPQVFSLEKVFLGSQGETATGESYPRDYSIKLSIAENQTINNLVITDQLPDNVAYLSTTVIGGGTVVTEPAAGVPSNPPNNEVVVNFAAVTGTAAPVDAEILVKFFVPDADANSDPVIDPINADGVNSSNNVTALGDWIPSDVRDQPALAGNIQVDVPGPEAGFDAKSLAIQKSTAVSGTEAAPGETVTYTLDFQVSDYFAFEDIVITDVFTDGQRFDFTLIPTLELWENGNVLTATPVNFSQGVNFTHTLYADGDPNNNVATGTDGRTEIVFDVSKAITDNLLKPTGQLIGGLVDGDTPLATDETTGGRIVFRTVIQDAYSDDYLPTQTASLDERDSIGNDVTIVADVLDTATLLPNGETESDTSSASLTIVESSLAKSIYALNGVVGPVTQLMPGDEVTYRLEYELLSGDYENFKIADFLPLPIFNADDPDADGTGGHVWTLETVGAVPGTGEFMTGPTDTLSTTANPVTPTVSVDSVSNALNFDYGTREDTNNNVLKIDVLFSITVSSEPMADGLVLTNQASQSAKNTAAVTGGSDAIHQVTLLEPELHITKGVVATNNSAGEFSTAIGPAGVTFHAPGSATPFTGTITSDGLATQAINANVSKVDAGDLVTFAVVIENNGNSDYGAFDIRIQDTMPAGFDVPTAAGPTSVAPNLVLYYDFEETGTSITNYGSLATNGTIEGMAETRAPGAPGAQHGVQSLSFTGTNGHHVDTTIDANTMGVNGATDYTMAAWLRPLSISGDRMVFGSDGGSVLHNGTRNNTYYHGHFGNDHSAGTVDGIPLGQWRHVTWRYQGGAQQMFVNGVPLTGPNPRGPLNNPADILIGSYGGGAFQGDLDDVVIYNTALSNSEIADLAAGQIVGADFGATGINLQVHDGAGTALPFTEPGVGGFFGSGIELTDPAIDQGAIEGYSGTNGKNVIVVTYDLEVAATSQPLDKLVNDANLFNYAGREGGTDFTTADLAASASTTIANNGIAKTVVGTSHGHTTGNNVAIGELVTYEVVVTIPEGTSNGVTLVDTLDAGLAFVSLDSIVGSSGVTPEMGTFADVLAAGTVANVGAGSINEGRELTFDFGNIVNANRDNATADTVTIRYTAAAINASGNDAGMALANDAVWTWNTDKTVSTSVTDITIREPNVSITTSVNTAVVTAGETITYTVEVKNNSGATAADAFDLVLTDLLPAGITLVGGSLTNAAGVPATLSEAGGNVSATWTSMGAGQSSTLTFQALVGSGPSPDTTIANEAIVVWTSLPGTATPSLHNTLQAERTGSTADTGGAENDYTQSDSVDIRIGTNVIEGFVYREVANVGTRDVTEPGVSGLTIELTGTDHLSNTITLTTTTATDGAYKFEKLRPGNYTVKQLTQPGTLQDGPESVGATFGGDASVNDAISNIVIPLGADTAGSGYNFGEFGPPELDLNGTADAGVDYAANYLEGTAPTPIVDTDVDVHDLNHTGLQSLTIVPSDIVDGSDEILVLDDGSPSPPAIDLSTPLAAPITVTIGTTTFNVAYDGTTITVADNLGVEMPLADAEAFLAATKYQNTSLTPTEADRTFDIQVNDGDDNSNLPRSTISVVRDPEDVEWSIASTTTSVGEGNNANWDIDLTGSLRGGENASVVISLSDGTTGITAADLSDTADANQDDLYDAINTAVASRADLAFDDTTGALTFTSQSDGDTMETLSVSLLAVDDSLVEGNETFAVSLSASATPSSTGSNVSISATKNNVNTTVTDNDTAEWSISSTATTVGEGSNATWNIDLGGALGAAETASVVISLSDGTTGITAGDLGLPSGANQVDLYAAISDAVAARADLAFDDSTGTLTFTSQSEGDTMETLSVSLAAVNDNIVESDEALTVAVTAAAVPSSTGADVDISATSNSVDTTITDNDSAEVTIAATTNGNETGPVKGEFSVMLSNPSSSDTVVNFSVGGTANGNDHTTVDGTVTIFAGDLMATIVVPVNDDMSAEGTETVVVTLDSINAADPQVTVGTPNSDTIEITDNDPAVWSLTGDTDVDEGALATYTINLARPFGAGESATVKVQLTDGATNDSDVGVSLTNQNDLYSQIALIATSRSDLVFDSVTGELTYTATNDGDTMTDVVVSLEAKDDAFAEGTESYTVNITDAAIPTTTGLMVLIDAADNAVTTTIADTQGPAGAPDGPVQWSITGDATVDEGAAASYTISLAGSYGIGETVRVQVVFTDATVSDEDVELISDNLTDLYAELALVAAARPDLSFDGVTGELTFTSQSDDDVMEDINFTLDAVNDALIEGDEAFSVDLSDADTPSDTGLTVTIDPANASATTTINDTQGPAGALDGPAEWSVSGPASSDEGTTPQYTIALSGTFGAGEDATVDIALVDVDTNSSDYAAFVTAVNTAVGDYAGPGSVGFDGTTLTFTATADGDSMTPLLVDLSLTADNIAEGPEDFRLDLSNPGSFTGANVATNATANSATTTINDIFGGATHQADWSITGDASVDEGGTATYTIGLSQDIQSGENASVQLTLADLETDGADYADFAAAVQDALATRPELSFDSGSGTLTFTGTGAMMAALVITLDAIDDTLVEGPERYQVLLSNPMSTTGLAVGIDAANSDVTTTIVDTVDDDGPLEQAVWSLGSNQTVSEGNAGAYAISLASDLQNGEIVEVDVTLTDIDTVPADYDSFDDAMNDAVTAYTGPGTVAWDGTTLTFTSDGTGAMDPLNISLGTVDDAFAEGTEDYRISLSNANSLTGAATSIDVVSDDSVTTIDDTVGPSLDDVQWTITGDNVVDEGGTAGYSISLTNSLGAGEDAFVDLTLSDVGTTSADYAAFNTVVSDAVTAYNTGLSPGSLTWDGTQLTFTAAADGDTLTDLEIDLGIFDDGLLEGPEAFDISLADPGSATGVVVGIDPLQDIVVTTIRDTVGDGGPAEPGGEWSLVGPATVNEGEDITYNVGLTGDLQSGESTSIQLTLSDIETTDSDYADFDAAVTAAVAAYNLNPANSGSLSWNGTSVTFTSDGTGPMGTLAITLGTVDDPYTEGPERLNVSIANPTSTTGLSPTISATQSVVTTTIVDAESSDWSVTGPTAGDEGSTPQYTVALSGQFGAGETASVAIGLTDVETNSSDYADFVTAVNDAVAAYSGNGGVTFDGTTLTYTASADGDSMEPLVIDLPLTNDAFIEGLENFTIGLSLPSSTTGAAIGIAGAAESVTTTINDTQGVGGAADGPAEWSITGPADSDEGTTPRYVVSLSGTYGAGEIVTMDLSLTDVDTNSSDYADMLAAIQTAVDANPDVEFDGVSKLTYTSPSDGAAMADLLVDLSLINDANIEGDEDFTLSLADADSTTGVSPTIGANDAVTTTINDTQLPGGVNDGPATWSITSATSVDEGGSVSYTISLTGAYGVGEQVSVNVSLTDDSTSANDLGDLVDANQNDLYAALNTLALARPDLSLNTVTGDLTFTSQSDGDTMADVTVSLEAENDAMIEGPESFTVTLSDAATPSSTGVTVVNVDPAANSVTTTVNDTQGVGGALDGPGVWALTGPAAGDEGSTAVYTLSLSGTYGANEVVTVDLDLDALDTTSADYAAVLAAIQAAADANDDVTFDGVRTLTYTSPADGASMADLTVNLDLIDDTLIEGPEDFQLSLSNPTSSTGANVIVSTTDDSVTTTINDTQDDDGPIDGPPTWAIFSTPEVDEGQDATFTISLSGTYQASENVSVVVTYTDVDTNAADVGLPSDNTTEFYAQLSLAAALRPDLDFNAVTNTLTFISQSDGDTMEDIDVVVTSINDGLIEGPEDISVSLSPATTPSTTGLTVFIDPNQTTANTTINDTQVPAGPLDGPAEWSVTGDNAIDEGETANFAILLNGNYGIGERVTVNVSLTDDIGDGSTNGSDLNLAPDNELEIFAQLSLIAASRADLEFDAATGDLTFISQAEGDSMEDIALSLIANNDAFIEGDEVLTIALTSAEVPSTTGVTVSISATNDDVTTTVGDTQTLGGELDGPAEWMIDGPTSIDEGEDAIYTISLSETFGEDEVATVDITFDALTTNANDYDDVITALSDAADANPDVTFTPNKAGDGGTFMYTSPADDSAMTDLTVTLPITDDVYTEGPESFSFTLSDPTSTTDANVALGEDTSVTTAIDDTQGPEGELDGPAEWTIDGPTSIDEGENAVYTISLSETFGENEVATVDVTLADLGTNTGDYASVLTALGDAADANLDVTFTPNVAGDGGTFTYTSPADKSSMADLTVTLPITNDVFTEGPESFSLTLSNPTSTTGANVALGEDTSVTTAIDDTQGPEGALDGPAEWTIEGPTSIDEGENAVYTISLSETFGEDEVAAVDVTLADLGTNTSDYADVLTALGNAADANQDVTFTPNVAGDGGTLTYTSPTDDSAMAHLTVTLPITEDIFTEGPESFSLTLSNPTSTTGANVDLGEDTTVTTAIDDTQGPIGDPDGAAEWTIAGPTSIDEGEDAVYTISLSETFGENEIATVDIAFDELTTKTNDYNNVIAALQAAADANLHVTFTPNLAGDGGTFTYTSPADKSSMTDLTVTLPISDDVYTEGLESFNFTLSNPTSTTGANVALGEDTSVTTEIDDTQGPDGELDGPAEWTISGPASIDEGENAVYTISLSETFGENEVAIVDIAFDALTTNSNDYDDVITALSDAADVNQDVTFTPNVAGDGGTFTYTSPADGSSMTDLTVTLPINNDVYTEGAESFSFTLSDPTSTTGANVALGEDTSVTTAIDDTQGPAGELDGPAEWTIAGPTSIDEGEDAVYTISLSETFGENEVATVEITLDELATNSNDYSSVVAALANAATANPDVTFTLNIAGDGGTLTYTSPTDGSAMTPLTVTVPIANDGYTEGPEDFSLTLSNASSSTGANVAVGSDGSVTKVIDDTQGPAGPLDGPAEWSITGPVSIDEGEDAVYTISLSETFGEDEVATVDVTLDPMTTNANDYDSVFTAIGLAVALDPDITFTPNIAGDGGTMTYTAPTDGASMQDLTFTVPITEDAFTEGPESFSLTLSNPTSTTGANVDLGEDTSVTTAIDDTQGPTGELDGPAEWTIAGPTSIDEGENAVYTISLSESFGENELATVDVAFDELTTNANDYAGVISALQAAADANPDVTFTPNVAGDGGRFTYTSPVDGSAMSDLTVTLPITDEDYTEGPESFNLTLSNPTSTTDANVNLGSDTSVTTAVDDTQGPTGPLDGPSEWSITGPTEVDEGATAHYQLSLSGTFGEGETAKVDIGLTDLATNSSVVDHFTAIDVAVDDYTGPGDVIFDGTTITFTAGADGDAMLPLVLDLLITDDNLIEGPEDFRWDLTNATSTTDANVGISSTNASLTTVINDTIGDGGPLETAVWSLTGSDEVEEGGVANYKLSLGGIIQEGEINAVRLQLQEIDTDATDHSALTDAIETAIVGRSDLAFDSGTGVLTFTAPVDAAMEDLAFSLVAINDGEVETPEDYQIVLSDAVSLTGNEVTIDPATGDVTTTIQSTDPADPPSDDNPNAAPIASDDAATTFVDQLLAGNLFGNDGDPDGDVFTLVDPTTGAAATGPVTVNTDQGGSVTIDPLTGDYTYTPPAGFEGTDGFVYQIMDPSNATDNATVTFTVEADQDPAANDAPSANDDAAITQKNTPTSGNVLGNDNDLNGDPITVTEVNGASFTGSTTVTTSSGGTLELFDDGTYNYTPGDDFTGTEFVSYTIDDGGGGIDSATLFLSVFDSPPVVLDDINNTSVDTPVDGNILTNDHGGDPNDDVVVGDGNGNPIAPGTTLPTDQGGTLLINPDGTYMYTPPLGFVGEDSITLEVCDEGGNCVNEVLTIEVRDLPADPMNTAPIAENDVFDVFENGTITSDLLNNDGDPDGDVITIVDPATGEAATATVTVTTTQGGTVDINPDGMFTYTPLVNFAGVDTFDYTIIDPAGATDDAMVTINVQPDGNGPLNDPPHANDDAVIGQKNDPVVGNVLNNDTDMNDDPLTVTTANGNTVPPGGSTTFATTGGGTVVIQSDGGYTYTPGDDFFGNDSFLYTVFDGNGGTDTATALVTIFDRPPMGTPDSVTTPFETPVSDNVLTNDFEPDTNDELAVTQVVGQPITSPVMTAHGGTVDMAPDGTFTYTPASGFQGGDAFTYEACDEGDNCFTETVSVDVRNATVGVAKDSVWNQDNDEVTFIFTFEHLGNSEALNFSLIEDLDNVFGNGNFTVRSLTTIGPLTFSANSTFNGSSVTELISTGSSLQPGETAEIAVEIDVHLVEDAQDNGLGTYENQVTLISEDALGATYTDLSVDGTNADPDGDDNPTNDDSVDQGSLIPNATVGVAKDATVDYSNLVVTLDLFLEHFGNTIATDLSVVDDLDAVFGAGTYSVISIDRVSGPNTLFAKGSYDGSLDTELISSTSTFAPGDTAHLSIDVQIISAFGTFENQATATATDAEGGTYIDDSVDGTEPDPDNNDDPTDNTNPTEIIIADGAIRGSAYADINNNGVFDEGELGIPNIPIHLEGTDIVGNTVSLTAITDADGNYTFTRLVLGEYVLWQEHSDLFIDGQETAGNFGGDTSVNDQIAVLLTNVDPQFDANGYNFGERGLSPLAVGKDPFLVSNQDNGGDSEASPEPPDVNPELASPLTITGTRLDIVGTDQDDTIQVMAGTTSHRVLVNFVEYFVDASTIDEIVVDGGAGTDAIETRGTTSDDTLTFTRSTASLVGDGYRIDVADAENVVTYGGGGAGIDSAVFVDSPGADEFVSTPTFAQMSNASFVHTARHFESISAESTAGNDRATLHGSDNDDLLVSHADQTSITSDGYTSVVAGFNKVRAFAHLGYDQAILHDTVGNDVFAARADSTNIRNGGFSRTVNDFDQVTGQSSAGGTDVAYLHGTDQNDSFHGLPQDARLSGSNFDNRAIGFSQSIVYAHGGDDDRATLSDSAGNDTLVARPTSTILRGEGFKTTVRDFDQVTATADQGGTDVATFFDSEGDDTFLAGMDVSSIQGNGYHNLAYGFQTVVAQSSFGNDSATLNDSAADDVFVSRTNQAVMRDAENTIKRIANRFESVSAIASEGNDIASFLDVESDETVSGQADQAHVHGKRNHYAQGFTKVVARSKSGHLPTSEIDTVDYLFSKLGDWDDFDWDDFEPAP